MENDNARKLREAREALGAFPVPPKVKAKLEGLADVLEDQERRLVELEDAPAVPDVVDQALSEQDQEGGEA